MKTQVFLSPSFDVYFNLALEDSLFRSLQTEEQVLFLWRNDPCIVIGRYQNPWLECRTAELEKDGVLLARRQSGGGTVYHDRGNLCFTIMGPRNSFDRRANIRLIVAALQNLGIPAYSNDRLDILVDKQKVSGSAFREIADRSFHHGTLLVDADLGRLTRYLASTLQVQEAKGVRSVRSPVANLRDFLPSLPLDTLELALAKQFHPGGVELLALDSLSKDASLQAYRAKMASREWRYAASPPFTLVVANAEIELQLSINAGIISGVQGSSTDGKLQLSESCKSFLQGQEYGEAELALLLETASKYESSSYMAGALKKLIV
ncbi:lipoate--protein ligase LplA [Treponema sp.]